MCEILRTTGIAFFNKDRETHLVYKRIVRFGNNNGSRECSRHIDLQDRNSIYGNGRDVPRRPGQQAESLPERWY